MEPIVINGRIEFCNEENKEWDSKFAVILSESAAFQYGNQTQVTIKRWLINEDKRLPDKIIDTRYDITIKCNRNDFRTWIEKYFQSNMCEHKLTFYD